MIWAPEESEQHQKNKFLQVKSKIKIIKIEICMKKVLLKKIWAEMNLVNKINWVSSTLYQTKLLVMKNLWSIFQPRSLQQEELLWRKFVKMNPFFKQFRWLNKIFVQRILMNVMVHAAPNFLKGRMKTTNKNLRSWGLKLRKLKWTQRERWKWKFKTW